MAGGGLEAFDVTTALEILATFAGAWGSLHRDTHHHRWQYRALTTNTGTVIVLGSHIKIVALRSNPDTAA